MHPVCEVASKSEVVCANWYVQRFDGVNFLPLRSYPKAVRGSSS